MLFNSPVFLFLFLPVTLTGFYFLHNRRKYLLSHYWLAFASMVFYGYWNPIYLIIIAVSIGFNFSLGKAISFDKFEVLGFLVKKRHLFISGIIINVLLLGYYKYADFVLTNFARLIAFEPPEPLNIALPLAISFFTFQQIAYLVDSYRGETHEYDFFSYILFVTFFPQLIAGPIVHHKEMMPQFDHNDKKPINWEMIYQGLFILSVGLFKKVVIADSLSPIVASGFGGGFSPSFIEGWLIVLSYTMQIYFDFSGYSDMAIGLALFFNIKLPINFNSPYKSSDIQQFWQRWHITLSRWLKDYVYIPLGGNLYGFGRTLVNLFLTFLIGGIWHGAGWTFVLWGMMHGFATGAHRVWKRFKWRLPNWAGVLVTFFFINISWVFFRSETVERALFLLKIILGFGPQGFSISISHIDVGSLYLLPVIVIIVFVFPNTLEMGRYLKKMADNVVDSFSVSLRWSIFMAILLMVSVYMIINMRNRISEFLYFDF